MKKRNTLGAKLFHYFASMLDYIGNIVLFLFKPVLPILWRAGAGRINTDKLRGWVIVVGIVIVTFTIWIGTSLLFTLSLMSTGFWKEIRPDRYGYTPLMKPALLAVPIIFTGLIIASLYSTYLFFKRKKAFPRWSIAVALSFFMSQVFDFVLQTLMFPNDLLSGSVWYLYRKLFTCLAACVIWVSYMLLSKRVKATFVK